MNAQLTIYVSGTDLTVTVTRDASAVEHELRALKSSVVLASKLVVGLGVEWNSADANAKPTLLQFCIRTRCLVILLHHMFPIPLGVKDFLADSKIAFVGFGIQSAVAKLKDGYGLACANAVELAALARDKNVTCAGRDPERDPDVMDLAYAVCQVYIGKALRLPCFYSPSSVPAHDEIVNAAKDAYAAYHRGQTAASLRMQESKRV